VILVDTPVWVDFFRGTERAADLAEHLKYLPCPIGPKYRAN
jgi:hypothetical protein